MATLLEMKQRATKYMIPVMQAFVEGKQIKARRMGDGGDWETVVYPSWDWVHFEYEVEDAD